MKNREEKTNEINGTDLAEFSRVGEVEAWYVGDIHAEKWIFSYRYRAVAYASVW